MLNEMLFLWMFIFVVSLVALVKGADWLIGSAEKIGLVLGLSPFLVGVLIVGVGTSCPELISSSVAAFKGLTDVPVANAVGSNIANILLVVGFSAVIGRKLKVSKSLIDLDLPLLSIGTVLFLGIVVDGKISLGESIIMLVAYVIYLLYTVLDKDGGKRAVKDLPSRRERREKEIKGETIKFKDIWLLLGGIILLVLGAQYLVEALIKLSEMLGIATGMIAITAVALGTSLPELVVSIKAAAEKKSDVALGNIFGSNVFNALVVIGFPGLFRTLTIDSQTMTIGIPTMALATLLFVISGISRRIHVWEGLFYLALYVLFVAKLFAWF